MRRSRYRRDPKYLPHRLTSRDLEILKTIGRFKYLSSQQLSGLFSITCQGINKRLKLLFHHHYLGKLPAKLSPNLFNSPDVYFINLDRRAAKILKEQEVSLPYQKRSNSTQPKRDYIQHTLLTNDILIAFELACHKDPHVEFLSSQQLLEQSSKDRKKLTHPWKVTAFLSERNISRSVYPDAAFALLDKRTGKTQLYLIEADRMTQPLVRNRKKLFRVSNIKAKLIIYHTAWKQGVFRHHLDFPATRILFVTLSARRAEHMNSLVQELFRGKDPGLFVFTDKGEIFTGSVFMNCIFRV